jgi:hypothetical protein
VLVSAANEASNMAEVQHELTYSEATPARQDEMATMGTGVPQWANEEEFKV